jgi:hypothetical protein
MSQNQHHHSSELSDARYIFILFWLIFVVLFFAFLIYFVYGQRQFNSTVPADNPTFENNIETNQPSIDTVRVEPEKNTPAPSVATTVPANTVSTNTIVDPSRYNPRDTATVNLRGRELLDKYFSSIQAADYQTACSLLSNTICNARRDIFSFSQFLNKTNGGYQVKNITLAKEQKPSEAIYCVEYTYSLRADLNPQPITEYFQYRIKTRPDGVDEISARVCEKVVKDGRERPCPIITPKKYCF